MARSTEFELFVEAKFVWLDYVLNCRRTLMITAITHIQSSTNSGPGIIKREKPRGEMLLGRRKRSKWTVIWQWTQISK